jgi:hypothetical protein|tara:strand:- start:161 stop:535 length:375 start_codon:yes stop_codon:yes gene_type:complete
MSYIQANDLNTIEEEINKFQSSNFNIKNNTHIVIQTLNGYEINLNEADSSSKELHSLISNIVSDTSGNETILKDDLVYLITELKISSSGKQSLDIKSIKKIEETPVQQNVEIQFKECLLNLIKV